MIDSLVAFITGLADPLGSGGTAVAIVLFTLAVRTLLLPFVLRQARSAKVRERLAPKVRQLQKRHKRDPQRLHKEVGALYAKEGSSQFAGILPGLAQVPFMWLMYQVATHPTALVGHDLFGAPLGQQMAGVIAKYGLISGPMLVFVVLVAAIAVVALLSWHRTRKTMPAEQPELMRKILPLMSFGAVAAALVLPLAAGLYLLVSTTWTLVERALLFRPVAIQPL